MSSFNPIFRRSLGAAALLGLLALAGCTMTPALNEQSAIAVSFAQATNPLEQIVYQDLGTRFAHSDSPNTPQVSVQVTSFARALGQSVTNDPAKGNLMTATGILRIMEGGQQVLVTTRQATATYSADSQVISDTSAVTAAQEQAAHALADTLELTIISALTPQTASR